MKRRSDGSLKGDSPKKSPMQRDASEARSEEDFDQLSPKRPYLKTSKQGVSSVKEVKVKNKQSKSSKQAKGKATYTKRAGLSSSDAEIYSDDASYSRQRRYRKPQSKEDASGKDPNVHKRYLKTPIQESSGRYSQNCSRIADTGQTSNSDLRLTIRFQQEEINDLKRDMNNLEHRVEEYKEENISLKKENEKLKKDLLQSKIDHGSKLKNEFPKSNRQTATLSSNKKQESSIGNASRLISLNATKSKAGVTLVIPTANYEDSRVTGIFHQLLDSLKRRGVEINLEVKDGRSIDTQQKGALVTVPFVHASRVGSDLSAALQRANLKSNDSLLIIIFNHYAKHMCKIRVPTHQKLSDRNLVERSRLIVDAVFWEKQMYQCEANDKLLTQLKQLFESV